MLTCTRHCRHFSSPAGLNPGAGCWQPPAPLLLYPHSPVSPYRHVPAGYSGWQWQSQLPPPSPQPTRSVVAIARAGTCLTESRLRHVVGGNGSIRAVTAIDPHGSCSVVSFHDVRSAVAFFDAITKVSCRWRRDAARRVRASSVGLLIHGTSAAPANLASPLSRALRGQLTRTCWVRARFIERFAPTLYQRNTSVSRRAALHCWSSM